MLLLNAILSFFLLFLIILTLHFSIYSESSQVQCIASEREALLEFKHHLKDPTNRLLSWNGKENCCKWTGVVCSNLTGHVVELHLRSSRPTFDEDEYEYDFISYKEKYEAYKRSRFGGEISPSLLDLKHMTFIDFSGNDFGGIRVPPFIGSIINLTHLNISYSNFSGMIPHQMANLSNLCYLDLNGNYNLYARNVQWLSLLTSLKYLDLSYVNLSAASDLPHVLGTLPSLTELYLSDCELNRAVEHSSTNFSSLVILDLSYNYNYYYQHSFLFPKWIFGLKKLVSLNLRESFFQDSIPNGIQNLTYLKNLDLSFNHFNFTKLLWLSSFTHLVSLNLGHNDFQGPIPDAIQNLTYLENLDLSYNQFNSTIPMWLNSFTHLVSLKLQSNNFQGPILDTIQNLTYLENLDVSSNQFNSIISMGSYSFNHLKFLNLDYNNLCGTIPNAIGNLTSLVELDLSSNQFEGKIPRFMGNLCNLREFYVSNLKASQEVSEILKSFQGCVSQKLQIFSLTDSKLFGHLTDQIGTFVNLVILDLSNNSIPGGLPNSLGKLESLKYLYLGRNQFIGNPFEAFGSSFVRLQYLSIEDNFFQGVVTEDHLANSTSLKFLVADNNQLTLKVRSNWSPCFQLERLGMQSWQLGPNFPSWVQSQKNLTYLDISNTSITDSIPVTFWNSFNSPEVFDLSHNQIFGQLPNNSMYPVTISSIDLSSNQLSGQLPHISPDVFYLDLSNNLFSGTITKFLCQQQFQNGNLEFLSLASNNLSGKIPDCWMGWEFLRGIRLENNNFTGIIPSSLGNLAYLKELVLHGNKLSRKFPNSLRNCTNLIILDLGENKLSGSIPAWIGKWLLELRILCLHSNRFSGQIPKNICALSSLQVLDISQNNLSGNIPKCLHHFSIMSTVGNSLKPSITFSYELSEAMVNSLVMVNGKMVQYNKTLGLLTMIDLSDNKLSGEIPKEITGLCNLLFLNLSRNLLTGQIPKSIGSMRWVLSIDFSWNNLSGEIPQSMTNLSLLNNLNLSFNDLKGEIPKGTQLQSFEASSYIGNQLCGSPLPTNCIASGSTQDIDQNGKDGNGHGTYWFYVSMALGFIVGFWGVMGPLFISRSWRFAYYRFLDKMWYKLQDCCTYRS